MHSSVRADHIRSIRQKMGRAQVLPGPLLDLHLLEAFERDAGVELPATYRTFLLQIGNGAAGPSCTLYELGAAEQRNHSRKLSAALSSSRSPPR